MAKKKKSESLFEQGESLNKDIDGKINIPPAMTPEQKRNFDGNLKNDYLFKEEMKQELEKRTKKVEEFENKNIQQQLKHVKNFASQDENILIKRTNERRKRHYTLEGDIRVYCYIKNNWPHMIVKPLTISIDETIPIPPLGPFGEVDEFLLEVVFRPLTLGVKRKIEPFIYEPLNANSSDLTINAEEYRKLAFIFCFKKWNLPINLNVENDVLDEESRNILLHNIHPVLFDVIGREFIRLNEVSEKEMNILDKQCQRLFAKSNQGVSNPLEGIRLYCEASVFAKEFALSGKDLESLPLRVATLIRHVSHKGSEIQAKELESSRKSNKRAKVIGGRGKK